MGNAIVSVPPKNVFPAATNLMSHNIIFYVGGTFVFLSLVSFLAINLKVKVELYFVDIKVKI